MNAEGLKSLIQSPTISLSELRSLRNYCALNADVADVFDELTDSELSQLIDRLFAVVVDSPVEGDERANARCALQCLSNAANRSRRLAEFAYRARPLTLWRALLRDAPLRLYSLAALTTFMRVNDQHQLVIPQQSDDAFTQLYLDVLSLWITEDEQHRSWIGAFFANCLQQERFMEREFGALGSYQNVFLSVVSTLLSADDVQKTTSAHVDNIQFCVKLLTSCLEADGIDSDAEHTDDRILLLLDILSSAATIRPNFDSVLHSETDFTPLNHAVAVLGAVVRSETQRSPNDNGEDDRLLTAHWRTHPTRRSEVKQASLRLIGHLCCESERNRRRAGELDALGLVLHCARLQESDRPFQVQWAVLAVRHLCLNCPENQQRLFAVDRVPSAVIDSDRLLESLGLRADVDSVTGQVRLAPLINRREDHGSS